VANLLDMTKIESGSIDLDREHTHVDEVVATALQRVSGMVSSHKVEVDLEANLPMLDLDVMLFEQVLVNLLDNASKYAPPGSEIRIRARRTRARLRSRFWTRGRGFLRIALSVCSRSFTASSRATASAPEQGSGSRYAAGL